MKLGLSLSGGGVRGAAQIGAIKALQENNIKIDAVAGTSAGSIIAAALGMGYTTEEMIKLFNYFSKSVMGIGPKNIYSGIKEKRGIKLGGLTSSLNLEKAIQEIGELKGVKNINDIKIPIAITTTDLIQNKEIVFTNNQEATGDYYIKDIEIGKAVRASSTFPGMYSPFEYQGYQFVDGGVFDNLPSKETRNLGVDKVLAIKFDWKTPRKQNTIYNIVMQSIDLMNENMIRPSIEASDYVLDIKLKDVKPFSMKKIDFCYEEGYKQTLLQINEIRKMLKS